MGKYANRTFIWTVLFYLIAIFGVIYLRNNTIIRNWQVLLIFIPLLLLAFSSETMSKGIMNILKPFNIVDFCCKGFSFVLLELPIVVQITAQFWILRTVILASLFIVSLIMDIKMFHISKKYKDGNLPIGKLQYLSIKKYFIKSIVVSFAFFLLQSLSICFYYYRLDQSSNDDYFIILNFVSFFLLVFSGFEIRSVTENNQRFLGWKAYFVYFYKILYGFLNTFSIIIFRAINLMMLAILINATLITIYYIFVFLNFINYKSKLYKLMKVDFRLKIKEWYIEGEV